MEHLRNEVIRLDTIESCVMSKLQHLLQQAGRAERLSKAILDMLTADRLQAFEVECRARSKTLEAEQQASSPSQPVKPAA